VVFKYFGQLCLVLAALSLVPLVMSVIFGDTSISLRYGIVIGGLAASGFGLARLRAPSRLQANEGMVLVALMFFFTPLVMSYPMMGSGLGFLDALFEAISGVTTTGLSAKATLVGAPQTFLFARAWMQWDGGLGVVILSLALVMQPGLVAKGLAVTEAETDDLIGGTRAYARRALKVYGVLTALGIIGSLAVGIGFFDAVLYTFAAFSTGGFAPHDGSLAAFGGPAQVWISLLCLAGAIPLAFYYRMLQVVETAMENTMGRPCHQK
jgi:trk system potassium uptake protein TrkH